MSTFIKTNIKKSDEHWQKSVAYQYYLKAKILRISKHNTWYENNYVFILECGYALVYCTDLNLFKKHSFI